MIYKGGLPFTFFKRPEVRSFLTALNSAYKAPSARYITGTGLNKIYTAVKERVDKEIKKEDYLNLCFDSVSNISYQRILNVSIIIKKAAFYYYNAVIGSKTNTAEF